MNLISTTIRSCSITFVLLTAMGCSSAALREGLWELSFDGEESQSGSLWKKSEKVHLRIEKDENGVEIVELERLDSQKGPAERRMYGQVQEKNNYKIVMFSDQDKYWVFELREGEVKSDSQVNGGVFLARHKEVPDTNIAGRWGLQWLSDSVPAK